MAEDFDKEPEVAGMFSDYNFSRAEAEGLWKKAGKSFKKFLTKLHKEKQNGEVKK